MNAVAHCAAYLGNKLSEAFITGETFETQDGKEHPRNSQYPIIVLTAKPAQLKVLVEKLRSSAILYLGFIQQMIDYTDDVELANALNQQLDVNVEYLAVGLFGENEKLNELTKKFSLLK